MRNYFYKLLCRYLSLYVLPGNTLAEINPVDHRITDYFKGSLSVSAEQLSVLKKYRPQYVLLNGTVHYLADIQQFLENLKDQLNADTRVIFMYYSQLWKPLVAFATSIGIRKKQSEQNWISPGDIDNFLLLSGYDKVREEQKILIPVYIPILSGLINRYLAPLPFFREFCVVNIVVARPLFPVTKKLSVSVLVPARNEAGNIEEIIQRLPVMGPDDELIFIEGNSTDNTWQVIQDMAKKYGKKKNIVIGQQEGRGKGDAVRKGFSMATKDILMILDADITVPPEDLPKFYSAITENKGEFINGSRLVYPMEKKAMRFFNILGNKFFAYAFSFVLEQRFKDTLCGTKVMTRENYLKLAANRSYFGEFDPFGDFDLLFGSARMGLKIVEVPITYRERKYGETNISRWKHGAILLGMLLFAARKIKFI